VRAIRSHWHAGCGQCRHLIYVAASHGSGEPVLPPSPTHALCPYCLHAQTYDPKVLILHSGNGTIYYPPDRNLADTTLLVAGFLAAIKLAKVSDEEAALSSPKMIAVVSGSLGLAGAIVEKLAAEK
jgi:hypothetical protein